MSSYKSIKIDTSAAKATKLTTGKSVNLTAAEVRGEDEVLHVHHLNYEKLMKAKRANRGTRLQVTEGEIAFDVAQGGNIFKSIWKGIKSAWNPIIKPALSLAADNLVPIASTYTGNPALVAGVRKGLKDLTGVGIGSEILRGSSGHTLKTGKLRKGTPEMKAHMTKLRGMRKNAVKGASMKAGSFRLS